MTLESALAPPADPVSVPAPPQSRRATWRGLFRASLVWLLVAAFFGLGLNIGFDRGATAQRDADVALPGALPPQFETYLQAWQVLQDNYVDPAALDPATLVYGSINGLISAVGDAGHTRFLTPAELSGEHSSLSGSVVGVGAVMSVDAGLVTVQSVILGSPADKAGLRSHDVVVAVNGQSTAGQDISVVTSEIRGEAGTVVKLSILHAGAITPVEVSVTRARVEVPSVSWALLPGTTVADVRVEAFSTGSAKDLSAALAAARVSGAQAFVLDLRSNPGGYVSEAVVATSLFLADGNVYQQRDRSGTITPILVNNGAQVTDAPLVVLVDNGTASAAEIIAGALQDAQRALLIGQTTFGTGTVLNEFDLPDGSALLVGTLEWLTRGGRQIWHHGIAPDIALPPDPAGRIVTPSNLANLDTTGLANSQDAALLRAAAELSKP